MNRKTSLVIALFIAAIVLLWLLPVRFPLSSVHPHQAVPKHTALFFSANSAQLKLITKKDTTSEMLELFVPNSLEKDLALFQDLFGQKLEIHEKSEFTVTVNPTKKLGIDLLFILPTGRGQSLEKLLADNAPWQMRTFTFQHQEVITLRKGEEEFSFAKFRNLLVFARHAYLVENAISQLKSPGQTICSQPSFRKLQHNIKRPKAYSPSFLALKISRPNFPRSLSHLIIHN